MEATQEPAVPPQSAIDYKREFGRKLMVLVKLKNATPERDEFCRIRTVETVSPGLWISAIFLNGSIQRFRPDKVRAATEEEERNLTDSEFREAGA